ncbi:MAG: transposase [Methanosarcinaceae archaeon]|nr:transposase [Methanosarcinaceae archaeon]
MKHIYFFISAPPFISSNYFVNVLKGVTAKRIFEMFPKLCKKDFFVTLFVVFELLCRNTWTGIYSNKKYINSTSNK